MMCEHSKEEDMEKQFLKLYGIGEENFRMIIREAKDYAVYNGIAMRIPTLPEDARIHLPFCFLPSEFPRKWFEFVYALQPYINDILYKIAYSKEILKDCLSSTIEADEFTRNIFNIYETVFDGQNECLSLGLIRTDYLLHCDSSSNVNGIKQVENNTIASGFGGVSTKLRDLYSYIFKKLGWKQCISKLPENESCYEMAKAMVLAWEQYGNICAVILFIVEESTFNICDQRLLEFKVLEMNKDIQILRCTFKDLRTWLDVKDERLYVKDKEVSLVYYRAGYAPQHYESADWKTRLLIEQSRAIKCPSVGLHLAGTKRVQLFLSQKGILEKFVNEDVAQNLRKVFANQYVLNMDEEGDGVSARGIQNPDLFVLKPEREGGGNNLYGSDIKDFLMKSGESRKSYILMERITPPEVLNCIIRPNKDPECCAVTNELGIYGVILGNKDKIHRNYAAGHLLRSKPISVNEGGVAAGYGALDYPNLV